MNTGATIENLIAVVERVDPRSQSCAEPAQAGAAVGQTMAAAAPRPRKFSWAGDSEVDALQAEVDDTRERYR